jgi:hypothetical protein
VEVSTRSLEDPTALEDLTIDSKDVRLSIRRVAADTVPD